MRTSSNDDTSAIVASRAVHRYPNNGFQRRRSGALRLDTRNFTNPAHSGEQPLQGRYPLNFLGFLSLGEDLIFFELFRQKN